MDRLTIKKDGGIAAADTETALWRLAKYEDLHEDLERGQEEIVLQLAQLRAAGKEKTARYRELLARKLQNAYVFALFQARGL